MNMNVIAYTVLAIGAGLPQFKTEKEAQDFAKTCNGVVIPIVDTKITDLLDPDTIQELGIEIDED